MIIGKLILTFGALVGWPTYELWALRRDKRGRARAERSSTEQASDVDGAVRGDRAENCGRAMPPVGEHRVL